ncbi:MAG: hypothetical protein V4457_12845 [Pseudomonadota bacterium]
MTKRLGVSQAVAYTGTSAASTTAAPVGVTAVRLVASTRCFVEIAVTPVAVVATSACLAADWPETFAIRAGEKVAAIKSATDGTLTVTWISA